MEISFRDGDGVFEPGNGGKILVIGAVEVIDRGPRLRQVFHRQNVSRRRAIVCQRSDATQGRARRLKFDEVESMRVNPNYQHSNPPSQKTNSWL
jgi:hypothetical protein